VQKEQKMIVISRCMGGKGERQFFHFKGMLRGSYIGKISVLTRPKGGSLEKGKDYLLYLVFEKIESEVLCCELINFTELNYGKEWWDNE